MLKLILKRIVLNFFNKKYKCRIYSTKASLKAKYAEGVGIECGSTIRKNVSIGYMSYINANSWVECCDIGKYCSISSSVMIGPTEHYTNRILSHPIVGNRKQRKVKIGNDVLISHGATILQGVSIGDGAIIADGSVVTKDVESYSVVGGVPAKSLKRRLSESEINMIKETDLYNKDIDEMKKIIETIYQTDITRRS